jgi:hypothetical protein
MFVNRYRILAGSLPDTSGTTMVVPFSLDFFPVDNSELVQTNFVDVETEKAINPIIDYEKSRFLPFVSGGTQISEIKYKLYNSAGSPLFYSDLGITDDDVKFRRNRFLNTFLKLSFYDSDEVTNSSFLFSIDHFSQLGDDQVDLTGCPPASSCVGTVNPNYGKPKVVTSMPVSYLSSDPISLPKKLAEGYYIYWLLKDVINKPKDIYVRATLNNAVNGKTIQFYGVLDLYPIEYDSSMFSKRNIKYTIFKDPVDGIFKYNIDNTGRSISINQLLTTINLYKLIVK